MFSWIRLIPPSNAYNFIRNEFSMILITIFQPKSVSFELKEKDDSCHLLNSIIKPST